MAGTRALASDCLQQKALFLRAFSAARRISSPSHPSVSSEAGPIEIGSSSPNRTGAIPPAKQAGFKETRTFYGELCNAPKYLLKEEVLDIFHSCGLTADRAFTVLDDKLRIKLWRLEFSGSGDYFRATQLLSKQPRIGTRFVRLYEIRQGVEEMLQDPVNRIMPRFRDQSLVMIGVPEALRIDSVERFFRDYALAPMGIHHFWVKVAGPEQANSTRARSLARMERSTISFDNVNNKFILRERRTVVKFASRAEA